MIRVPQVGAESGASLSSTKDEIVDALKAANARQLQRREHGDRRARRSAAS